MCLTQPMGHWLAEEHFGKTVDSWAYYNNTDEVELYMNGKSLGKRTKTGEDLYVMWRVAYEPGALKADRSNISADGKDLSFVTVELLDKDGNASSRTDELVKFAVEGVGNIVVTDNGNQNGRIANSKNNH